MLSGEFNSKSVYGILFVTLNNFSQINQSFLFKNVFTDKFLSDVKNNPKSAYSILNDLVIDIEGGKNSKTIKLLEPYKDKLCTMILMLRDYGSF